MSFETAMFEKPSEAETIETTEEESPALEAAREKALMEVRSLASRFVPESIAKSPRELEAFLESPQAQEQLAFHNEAHTRGVIERFRRVIQVLREAGVDIDPHQAEIGEIGAAFHDTVQDYQENIVEEKADNPFAGFKKVLRKRRIGQNEDLSGDQAVQFMKEYNNIHGQEIFSENDMKEVKREIDVTVPGFDPKLMTVIQPNLKSSSEVIDVALALSDLGTAGMEGPDKFLPEGDALFREENLDIQDAIYDLAKGKAIPERTKEYFRSRMLAWDSTQPNFAKKRKELFAKEVAGLPEAAQQALAEKLFTNFDESIAAAEKRNAERQSMTFEQLAREMGYNI